jgi:hypothetical protein
MAELELYGNVESPLSNPELPPKKDQGISMHPNPVARHLNLASVSPLTRLNLDDISGKLILQLDLHGAYETTMDLSGLPGGIYIVHVELSSGRIYRSRMIKD